MISILPQKINNVISARLNADKVYELRLRAEKPVLINYAGAFYYLCNHGISNTAEDCIFVTVDELNAFMTRATEFSLYALNNQLAGGFITLDGGIRLGVCGEIVREGDRVKTIKDFSSVNIRFPHEIVGCTDIAYSYINDTRLRSVLIIGPPGSGKTTFLRDICRRLCDDVARNVLLVDERCEIASVKDGMPQLDVGRCTDVISNCPKQYAFTYGIRSMRPDVIVTDEIASENDIAALNECALGGVTVIASAHGGSLDELLCKEYASVIVKNKIFSRYIILSNEFGPGTVENVFDGDFKCIYYGKR